MKRILDNDKRERLIKSFQRANKDPEMLEVADEGLEDYVEQLVKFEKLLI